MQQKPGKSISGTKPLRLRITDQESARVVAILTPGMAIVGTGCLLDSTRILTCAHVVNVVQALCGSSDCTITVRLTGLTEPRVMVECKVQKINNDQHVASDIAILEIIRGPKLSIPTIEFATPLRYSGKTFSVLGFPAGDPQGRNVRGVLNALDADGLVQMDSASPLLVEGGFSGSPVWSPDVGAFVGMVVTELSERSVSWCIPSRLLYHSISNLVVRFRIPPVDRPRINDYAEDDPNVQLFGVESDNGFAKLTAKIRKNPEYDEDDEDCEEPAFIATVSFKYYKDMKRSGYVTFITHPSFSGSYEDPYELFSPLVNGFASIEFYPAASFTVAAITDGGDTALTFNLASCPRKPKGFV